MVKISVIIPVYNTEKYLSKCLDSIINQDFRKFEIIIINDGSTDNSQKIIDNYKNKYPKIIRNYIQKNLGQGSARNLGIINSKGEYITFIDSDDYIEPSMLRKLYENLVENSSDISICNIYKDVNSNKEKFTNFCIFSNDNIENYMVSHPGPVARLYSKKIFIDNNIRFPENYYYEDLATIPILGLYIKKISFIDEYLYHYVIRCNSIMNSKKYSSKLEDIFYIMELLKTRFYSLKNYYYVLEYLYIEHLLYSASLRFIDYKDGIKNIDRITKIIRIDFPNWKNNKFYKKKSLKFKIVCNLVMHKNYFLLKILRNVKK